MEQPSSVKLVEICRVAPKPGAQVDLLSLPLTYFDSLRLRFPPVQHLYFYELTSSSSTTSTDSLLAYLKTSLSLTLKHFVPLAGNLTWPQDSPRPVLSYVEGDAVSLTVAESTDADNFDHLSSNRVFVESRDYHPLVPQLESSHEEAAAIALQITLFPGRRFAIGTAMHHAILDGKTSISFVKSWVHACSKQVENGVSDIGSDVSLPEKLKPLYDRTVCLVKAREVEAGETSYQVFSVDCRSRLDRPVPENYFGNCTRGVPVFAEANDLLGEDGLVVAVTAISEAIKGLDKNGFEGGRRVEGLYSTAGSHRFQIYDTDFGWGTPTKVEVVSIDRTGAFSVSDSKNGGGGVEVGVVLKKHVMEDFASLFAKGFEKH
ncbi:hypothetical protein ACLB2K_077529 [Fragaria x ananassa]